MNDLSLGSRDQFKKIILNQGPQTVTNSACRIRAHNDIEAMERWLDEYFDSAATYRTYKKEAERFLVWCSLEAGVNLAMLNRDHVELYIEFMKDPQPREKWCGPRGGLGGKQANGERLWYPFAGPLSGNTIKAALAILNSMMSYLVDARYVEFNPFALVRKKSRFNKNVVEQSLLVQDRILSSLEWRVFIATLLEEPQNSEREQKKKARLVFMVSILFYLGLRIEELAQARWHNFRMVEEKWWFFLRGKGQSLGKVPVNSHLLAEVMNYRHHLGLKTLPTAKEEGPVICSLKSVELGLTARQMSKLIKQLAGTVALKFPLGSQSAARMNKFSPHWLRHLSASQQDLAGISFTNIKSNLRHQSEQTTRQYVHAEDELRHQQMENLKI
jgi:integrase